MTNESGKKSFVVYETFSESLSYLPDDLRLKMYDLMFQYGLYETIPNDITPIERSILSPIMFGIDQAKKRRQINQENGSKAGNRIGNQNARKDKKCTECILYRKCSKSTTAEYCDDYISKNNKNENERNQAKTSENDLNDNVNDNANVFKAFSLNAPRFTPNGVSDLEEEFNKVIDELDKQYKVEKEDLYNSADNFWNTNL